MQLEKEKKWETSFQSVFQAVIFKMLYSKLHYDFMLAGTLEYIINFHCHLQKSMIVQVKTARSATLDQ